MLCFFYKSRNLNLIVCRDKANQVELAKIFVMIRKQHWRKENENAVYEWGMASFSLRGVLFCL